MEKTGLPNGLYELLVTEGLTTELGSLGGSRQAVREQLPGPTLPDRLALHAGRLLERAISQIKDEARRERGIALARRVVEVINETVGSDKVLAERPAESGTVLRAIRGYCPDGSPAVLADPLTPLLDTTLLTNAPSEPRVGSQLLSEIESADHIDVVMAFVRWSGIKPLVDALRRHVESGRRVRLLTTTYTGSTEPRALDELAAMGVDVRVSYDTGSTRLHAKAWLFRRDSGFSTAYIGSSNLTHSAQVTGLEWNVRVSGVRNPDVLRQVEAIFESYWNHVDFVPYDRAEFLARVQDERSGAQAIFLSPTELRAEPFQSRLLEKLELSRQQGHHRNLLVAATGTGKTVMAALDYLELRKRLPRARLLFVAHREEILLRSRATFCHALRDPNFGEDWVNGRRPSAFDHVFASIQSLAFADLERLAPDHFDVVIIDEFHHAAAQSYRRLLGHLRPRELLGLTATPERTDGQSILPWFDGRIAAELRLWDAIDQQRLCPFAYYGIHDGTDLTRVAWRRGKGYDVGELTNVLTRDDIVANRVIKEVAAHVADAGTMRALGFCIGVEHARFMARAFNRAGIKSVAVWADTAAADRQAALRDLAAGVVQVVFTVDLFNEGIDIPSVDTLIMLRPTESATLFIQQLGRGLRRAEGKGLCTVLDFVGHHRAEFRFDERFRALLPGTRKQLARQVEQGFPRLPAGCHMSLDRKSSEVVLRSIRDAIPGNWRQRLKALREAIAAGMAPTLANFLDGEGVELDEIYSGKRCWSDLLEAAGQATQPAGPHEATLRRALGRLLHMDDLERIDTYERWARETRPPQIGTASEREQRLACMLAVSLLEAVAGLKVDLQGAMDLLWQHPQVTSELSELMGRLRQGMEHVTLPMGARPSVPLHVHAQYTRREILAAMGMSEGLALPEWREGVRWVPQAKVDLFAVTIDKTSGRFSPTTRYRDYAISRELFHWESQSTTRAGSPTGLRYQRHAAEGSSIMIFVRKTDDDRAFYFIGEASYVQHENEAPMAITWRLHEPLPGDLYAGITAA